MPATKIINVSKSDDFEEVFDLFKNTDAEDVIFIFPKGSRFAKQEQYFEAIKEEADSSGKKASVMSADPRIVQFALQHGLDVFESRSATPKKQQQVQSTEPATAEPVAEAVAEDDSPPPEPIIETAMAEEEPDEGIETILASAKTEDETGEFGEGRVIKDILPSYSDRSLKIKEERERTFDIDIQRRAEQEEMRRGDIAKIWAGEGRGEGQRRDADFLSSRAKKPKLAGFFKRAPLVLTMGAVLVLVFVLYVTLGNARIVINPAKQELNTKLKISASSTATAVNSSFNQIPGQQFKEQKRETDTFHVTGQKDVVQKAGGRITIFNKGLAAQKLVATTRFKSSDGLIFRIPQTIVVPAGVKTGTIVTPGSIESVIYADRPGAEYNIGPTRFTIPGLEGTPKFNDFYAVSDKPMAGGIIGPAKVVTESDFAKAQEELAAKIKEKILKSLKNQGGELKIVDTVAIKFSPPEANAKAGEAADELEMSLEGSADTIAFRESDVIELLKNFVSQKNDMELLLKDLKITYANPQTGTDKTSLSFDAQVNGWMAAKLNTDAIKSGIRGMSGSSVRSYFQNIKEIESTHIILSPFWVRSIPKDIAKIKIDIQN